MPTAVPIPNQHRRQQNPVAPSPADNLSSPSTRWVGSPMSYKLIGSLGSRFYPSTSPGPFTGPLDLNDFKVNGGVPSSIDSDHGRVFRAIQMGDEALLKDELIQDYACCGLELHDLHALLEHFEEAHVVVLESPQLRPSTHSVTDNDAFDPDAMELDEDDSAPSSSASSPPSTPPLDSASASAFDTSILRASSSSSSTSRGRLSSIATNVSCYSSPAHSRQHSPHPDFRQNGENAFINNFTSFSQFSALVPESASNGNGPNSKCIPPALLFSPSTQNTPSVTPTGSRMSSPVPGVTKPSKKASAFNNASAGLSRSHSLASSSPTHSTPSSPSSSTNTSGQPVSKPFKCPTVGCNKSYKQANGLKYHITHGQCNFMPPQPGLEGLDEKEAEIKARPYVCQVGSCTRRYKNMNGLRYHYQHSGTHGALGLALLASGQHALQTGSKEAQGETTIPASILNTAAVNAANASASSSTFQNSTSARLATVRHPASSGTSTPSGNSTPSGTPTPPPTSLPSNTVPSPGWTLSEVLKNTHIKGTPNSSRSSTPLHSRSQPARPQLATNTCFLPSSSQSSATSLSSLSSKPATPKAGSKAQPSHYLPKQQTPPQQYVQAHQQAHQQFSGWRDGMYTQQTVTSAVTGVTQLASGVSSQT